MSDNISILTSTTNKYLTKTFSGSEFAEQRFSIDRQFSLSQEPVGNLQSLSNLLQKLENDPSQTIIRGSLIEDQTNPVSRNKETFTATPRQWCMIDIDSLVWDGDISDQQALLLFAIQQLPLEFRNVD